MWSSHTPRKSHDQTRSASPAESTDSRKRTSSDATPRQTPATSKFLSTANDHDTNKNVLPSNSTDVFSSSKRLGFFADKLSSSLSSAAGNASLKSSLHPSLLLHPHSHSRAESNTLPSTSSSPIPIATSPNQTSAAKSHTSPSKVPMSAICSCHTNADHDTTCRHPMAARTIPNSFLAKCIVWEIGRAHV